MRTIAMTEDAYGLRTSTGSQEARRAFETAVFAVAAHRPNAGVALQETLAADESHVGAHALTGFANLILARAELTPAVAAALSRARSAVNDNGATSHERVLVAALAVAAQGFFARAADMLDEGFQRQPAALLPFKLAHALRFMVGDAPAMLAASTRAVAGLDRSSSSAGFVLGCHAFALEEHGFYDEALEAGGEAVMLEPDDSWGLHAVSHVFEMRCETERGIDWLEASRPSWSRCNNFSFHMAWHLGLLHIERGDHERAVSLYDDEVRPRPSDDFRDMANAVSLLWRLELSGVQVGERWGELAEIAHRRRADTTLVFAALHNLAAMVAVDDREGSRELVAQIDARALGTDDQSRIAAEIGVPMASILTGRGAPADPALVERLIAKLPAVGGSNAQRDFFVLALAKAVGTAGNEASLAFIGRLRRQLKADDRLFGCVTRTLEARLSN
jgi:tetratricopeptide (TPR) repeat protein